jgi:hypothetical protein
MTQRRAYTTLLAIFLLVEGAWGLFTNQVFGVFTTNLLHAVIHILLGLVGFWAARTGRTRGYLVFVGLLLLAVGLLWFVPGVAELLVRLLNANRAVAYFNIAVGAVSFLIGACSSPRPSMQI